MIEPQNLCKSPLVNSLALQNNIIEINIVTIEKINKAITIVKRDTLLPPIIFNFINFAFYPNTLAPLQKNIFLFLNNTHRPCHNFVFGYKGFESALHFHNFRKLV